MHAEKRSLQRIPAARTTPPWGAKLFQRALSALVSTPIPTSRPPSASPPSSGLFMASMHTNWPVAPFYRFGTGPQVRIIQSPSHPTSSATGGTPLIGSRNKRIQHRTFNRVLSFPHAPASAGMISTWEFDCVLQHRVSSVPLHHLWLVSVGARSRNVT